ncbi:uncharacterized protein ACBR49_004678 [Aulostomus maculatus]
MSIEYTIDIQLTELGFPDILQEQETSAHETACGDTLPSSHSLTSLTNTHKERPLVRAAGKKTAEKDKAALPPSQSKRNKQTTRGSALPSQSEPSGRGPTAGPLLVTEGQKGEAGDRARDPTQEQQDVVIDSDDSDVSQVYEEEELDEEEEDEEGLNESSHSGDYCCSVCGLQLSSNFKLQDHMNLHTGARPYGCAECGKRFSQIYNYRVHLRTHAQTKVDRLQCRICQKTFASLEHLKSHVSRTHFESEFYECDLCKRVFTSLKACEEHVQLHKCMLDVFCETCGRSFSSPKSLARHRRKSHTTFKCTDCTKTFTKKNALLKHSFSHLGLLPYTCVRCHCHFRLAKLYRKHKCEPERIHCVACLREFISQEDFQQHKKDTGCWGNQEPKGDEIRCLECGQRFDTTEELKKHAGAHQRVLKCAECGKGFRSALLLMSHMGGHAGRSPCLCQSCGLGFPHQQNYDSHLKSCGKTPQRESTPKKRRASNSPSSEKKKLDKIEPDLPNASEVVVVPTEVADRPAAPVKESGGAVLLTEDASMSSEGSWKLTLDKQPPAGVNLVLFLPVCLTQSNDLRLPSQPLPDVQGQRQAAPPVVPLDLVTSVEQYPECEEPLDLSKNCTLPKSPVSQVPCVPVKSEPEDVLISGLADEHKLKHGKEIVKTLEGEKDVETDNTTSSSLLTDIKKEPQQLGWDLDGSTSCLVISQCREKEMKMEVDVPRPVSTDAEK